MIACKNGSDQLFCLNVEATTVREHSVCLTAFAGFWVCNTSGLPLTLGEPVLTTMDAASAVSHDFSPSSALSTPSFDVVLAAVQAYPVVEEVFEMRMRSPNTTPDPRNGRDRWEVRWCSEQGNPRLPPDRVRLPSKDWEWADDWGLDRAGGVAPAAPGMLGGGWESCSPKERGIYSSKLFPVSRSFRVSDPLWRRRWVRKRIPVQRCEMEEVSKNKISGSGLALSPTFSNIQSNPKGTAEAVVASSKSVGSKVVEVEDLLLSATVMAQDVTCGSENRQELQYTVMNRCECPLVVRQFGSNIHMELPPGASLPLHWSDTRLEPLLSITIPDAMHTYESGEGNAVEGMEWSGPVGLANIGTFPICIRPKPGRATPGTIPMSISTISVPLHLRAQVSSQRPMCSQVLLNLIQRQQGALVELVGSNRIIGVEVNIGRRGSATTEGGRGSSAVEVIFEEETWRMGDRFPTYRLENQSSSIVFYGQVSIPGPGDSLPPNKSCLFGWDQPNPTDERILRLNLSSEPLSSIDGKRLCKSIDIRQLGERVQMGTAHGRVEVVVEADGPSKVVRIYQSQA
ncbi:unnamed protein product, partial [Choristocarpus tenellus]